MKASGKMSQCRQGLGEDLGELQRLIKEVQQSSALVRASLYWRDRKCGKQGCRCQKGELHRSRAISVRQDGQSRVVSLRSVDRLKVKEGVERYRRFRQRRTKIKELMSQIREKVEILGKLQEVDLEELRC